MLRVSPHPSSGVLKTVTAASGTSHNIGTVFSTPDDGSNATRSGVSIWSRRREVAVPILWLVPEAAVTVFSTPDDGCGDTRNMYSDFAVNKYLHTVASSWIFINIESPVWLKSGKNIGHYAKKYVLSTFYCFPATLNRHKSAVLEWNGIRVLRWLRRCKNYSNAPHCCGVRTFSYMKLRKSGVSARLGRLILTNMAFASQLETLMYLQPIMKGVW